MLTVSEAWKATYPGAAMGILWVISSVIHGPDRRTPIRPETRHVPSTIYAPPGVEEGAVYQHLRDIQSNVTLVATEAETELLEVHCA